jgi:hypothetical protein
MANVITNEKCYVLDSTGVVVAVGTPVVIRKIVYFPTTVSDDVTLQDYSYLGVLRDAIRIKADPAVVRPVELDFGPDGWTLNGLYVSVVDHGSLDVYIGRN